MSEYDAIDTTSDTNPINQVAEAREQSAAVVWLEVVATPLTDADDVRLWVAEEREGYASDEEMRAALQREFQATADRRFPNRGIQVLARSERV